MLPEPFCPKQQRWHRPSKNTEKAQGEAEGAAGSAYTRCCPLTEEGGSPRWHTEEGGWVPSPPLRGEICQLKKVTPGVARLAHVDRKPYPLPKVGTHRRTLGAGGRQRRQYGAHSRNAAEKRFKPECAARARSC